MELLTSILLAAGLAAGPAAPAAFEAVVAPSDRMHASELDERTRKSINFPNELHRLYGSESAAKGDWSDALRQFSKAARYADKYSQHRISLMYWHGVGVPRDPAVAYAWADLAAERMYPAFLVLREKMWMELDEADRARALREGEGLYAQYGDAVAKPRLAAVIMRQNTQITGTRTGSITSKLSTHAGEPGEVKMWKSTGTDMRDMYASWRLNPDRYWAVEDAIWTDGSVEVGEMETTGR
ncbi:sel1 repeat family protein [Lysobacter changpingensis]|jgi:hypothetical protein|uniref:sel1 repeat family protein n=1 Tax=Lysobacter changpingensis TaxID=2792784 RepID=UPI001A8D80B0|nr:sel1 repeat family protein [Lysobacter changpingensis]